MNLILATPDGDGSARDFVAHWDWAASKGLLNRNTAQALRTAVARVMSVEGEDWERVNVRSLDVDDILRRFENLAKKDFAPGSLATYRSRFIRAHRLYLSFLADPRNYRPQGRDRGTPPPDRNRRVHPRSAAERFDHDQDTSLQPSFPSSQPATPRMIRYPFPVRDEVIAELTLPHDLRRPEVERLKGFLDSLAVDVSDGES